MVIILAIVGVIKVKCFLFAKISCRVSRINLLGKSNQVIKSTLEFTFLQLNILTESLLASTLVNLDSKEVQALHIANLVFQISKLSLNVFGTTKEVDLLTLVGESSSLNSFALTLGLKFGSIFFNITFTKLEIVFDLVSLDFVFEYLFRFLPEAVDVCSFSLSLCLGSLFVFGSFNSSFFLFRRENSCLFCRSSFSFGLGVSLIKFSISSSVSGDILVNGLIRLLSFLSF